MILSAFSLEGKVAVVTGCDTGLGQGWRWGWRKRAVTLLALTSLNRLKPSSRSRRWGVVLSLTADLRKIDGIPALLDRAVAEFGHIDITVNNAGLIRREDALEFSEKTGTMS